MITCEYCGVSYQAFQPLCDNCGAPLPAGVGETPARSIAETAVSPPNLPPHIAQIKQICERYEDATKFYPGEAIPERALHTAIKSFPAFPQVEDILLFGDATPMGSGVWGVVISQDGLYWKNSWTLATNRNFLAWADFAQREVKRHKSTLELGRGDVIHIAGFGNEAARQKAERLLKEIRAVWG